MCALEENFTQDFLIFLGSIERDNDLHKALRKISP